MMNELLASVIITQVMLDINDTNGKNERAKDKFKVERIMISILP